MKNNLVIEILNKVLIILKKEKKREREGICIHITNILTQQNELKMSEKEEILEWFKSQKPTFKKHREFYENENFSGRLYWWGFDIKATRQRILFVSNLIKLLEEDKI